LTRLERIGTLVVVQALGRTGILVATLLLVLTYGASLADAAQMLCFGQDGHAGMEGAVDHQPATPAGDDHLDLAEHGPCVDVVMLGCDVGPDDTLPAPGVAGPSVPPVATTLRPSLARRDDGRPLAPSAGFGSTLLRI
jgi:hypothetical protein